MGNLDDFLKGEGEAEAAQTETVQVETPEPVEAPVETAEDPTGPARDEKGRFAPKGEKQAEEPKVESPSTVEPQLDHAALIGERRRRQEAEAQIAELARQLQQYQQPQPQQAAPQGPPDRWEDPEGYDRWLVAQAAEAARTEAYQQFQYQRINMAAAQYRQQVADYDEKIQVFGQMAQANPLLIEELNRAPNPAEYAYNTAKTHLEISQYGGIEGLIKARVQEALKTQQPAQPQAAPPVPDTLADQQSARGSTEAFTPTPFENILGMAKLK